MHSTFIGKFTSLVNGKFTLFGNYLFPVQRACAKRDFNANLHYDGCIRDLCAFRSQT